MYSIYRSKPKHILVPSLVSTVAGKDLYFCPIKLPLLKKPKEWSHKSCHYRLNSNIHTKNHIIIKPYSTPYTPDQTILTGAAKVNLKISTRAPP